MKVHLFIKDIGGGQPVVQVTGCNRGGNYSFGWDPRRAAHVRTYDVSTEAGLKRFRVEQRDILNQVLAWPIFVDVTVDFSPEALKAPEKKAPEQQDGRIGKLPVSYAGDVGSSPAPATNESSEEALVPPPPDPSTSKRSRKKGG